MSCTAAAFTSLNDLHCHAAIVSREWFETRRELSHWVKFWIGVCFHNSRKIGQSRLGCDVCDGPPRRAYAQLSSDV
jgi:hypothetical protein